MERKLNMEQFYDKLYEKLKMGKDRGEDREKWGETKFHTLSRFKSKGEK